MLERQRAERVAAAREQLMRDAEIESSRSPEEIACRAGTASLEQFEVGCASEVGALRDRGLSISVVLITAVAHGLPVRHPFAALGYPPGVTVPKAHTTELLALARLAPPLKKGLQSESKPRRERRLTASVERRVQAGVAVSVLGDSVANSCAASSGSAQINSGISLTSIIGTGTAATGGTGAQLPGSAASWKRKSIKACSTLACFPRRSPTRSCSSGGGAKRCPAGQKRSKSVSHRRPHLVASARRGPSCCTWTTLPNCRNRPCNDHETGVRDYAECDSTTPIRWLRAIS